MIKKMKSRRRRFPGKRAVFSLLLPLLLVSGLSPSPVKKLEITADMAEIHLKPDESSPVIESLEKGTLLTRGSHRIFKLEWCYVYFISKNNGKTKSGYIRFSNVKKLFSTTRVLTIR